MEKKKNLIYSHEKHEYSLDGIQIPSVSNVLNILAPYSDFSTTGIGRGTSIHKYCELWDLGKLDIKKIKPEYKGYMGAWIKFKLSELDPNVCMSIENPICSETYRYGGTPDRVIFYVKKSGGLIIDIKTGQHNRKRTELQLNAYRQAVKESYGKNIDDLWEIILAADGTYKKWIYKKSRRAFNIFLSGLTVYNFKNIKEAS